MIFRRVVLAALVVSVGAAVAAAAPAGEKAAGAKPLAVLLLSGKNNHNWRETTPVLEKALAASGRFRVEVTEDPAAALAGDLSKYDVIVSNWTNWPDVNVRAWGEKAEKCFLEFVRGGKGFVVVHAACSNFYTWPEYQEMVGAWWDLSKTGHGAVHAFKVTITNRDHPVTRGMQDFTITDELWHRMGTRGPRSVLATAFAAKEKGGSGQDEPVADARPFGKGRCFFLVLGHDGAAVKNAGFQALLLRGTEWAATGEVTLPPSAAASAVSDVLKELAAYKAGANRKAAAALADLVRDALADAAARAEIAGKLAAFLASDATQDAKAVACEQLGLIGADEQAAALAPLLLDADLSLAARAALERIPGPAAAAALRGALVKAKGPTLLGIVNSAANRRDAEAVSPLSDLLASADDATRAAVLDALGKIGSAEAAATVADARRNRPADLPAPAAAVYDQAYLRCGRSLLADGKAGQAAAIFKTLYEGQPAPSRIVRLAALKGLLAALPAAAQDRTVKALTDADPQVVATAADFVAASTGAGPTRAYAAALGKMPGAAKALLASALGRRGDRAAMPAVLAEVGSPDAAVRLAAIEALAGIGDASVVAPLAARLAQGDPADRAGAQATLARLRAADADAAILVALKSSAPPVRAALIGVLASRQARSAVPALLESAADADPAVRAAALAALRTLAAPEHLGAVVKLLASVRDDADRAEVERNIVRISMSIKDEAARARPAASALAGAPPAVRVSLLRVLARLGGAEALEAVRKDLRHADAAVRDAAVRALADWPDAAPEADLLAVAEKTETLAHHVLALRGVVRMATTPGAHARPAAVALLTKALAVARRDEEKQAIQAAIEKAHWAVNLALAGTASSPDDLESDGDASGDQAAIDGNLATYWDEQDDQKLYILQVDWPKAVAVAALRITGHAHHNYAPKDFQVLCDDKVVKEVTGATYTNNVLVLKIPPTTCRKLALKITASYGRSPGIRELEIFDDGDIPPPLPVNIAPTGKTVREVREAEYAENVFYVEFPPVTCKTVELRITGYYGNLPAIRELEILSRGE